MKAIYQKPETEMIVVAAQQLMAGSLGNPEDGFNIDGAPETTSETSGNLSRRHSIWDDEEDF